MDGQGGRRKESPRNEPIHREEEETRTKQETIDREEEERGMTRKSKKIKKKRKRQREQREAEREGEREGERERGRLSERAGGYKER